VYIKMRLEIFVLGVTAFFVYNAYHDGKYTKMILSFKKYYQMIFYVIVGVSMYLLFKRSPEKGRTLLMYANNMIKYMPIDRSTIDMITPIFDTTSTSSNNNFMSNLNGIPTTSNENKMLTSGKQATKRCVSETKKKYVASRQNWCCGNCKKQLNAWFEVDHKVRLENGGGNDVGNLIALCRECHGEKTAMENL
jgi:hypothetical protein